MPGSSKARKHETWNNTDVRGPRRKAVPCLFSGLVVIASTKLPIPSRTRPISVPTPMVLRLKTWESRSPPDLKRDNLTPYDDNPPIALQALGTTDAGWSSPVARQAHNLKAAGSNPAPATNLSELNSKPPCPAPAGLLSFCARPIIADIAPSRAATALICSQACVCETSQSRTVSTALPLRGLRGWMT